MSNSSSNASGGGITIFGGTFLVFLFLKLAEIGAVKDWSWWWVTSPLWIPFAIGIVIIIGIGLYYLTKYILRDKRTPIQKAEERAIKQSAFQKRLEEMEAQKKKNRSN
jgi:hypothetical protein